ncbi:MAG: nucleoside phosphorylase [Prolixibacteraceae bacterium]|nr:nucleoside phosphorylase [Prolixibacteraceae bacterium]
MNKESELILNPDGTIFHLHLLPEQIADTLILVGDPGRVETVADFFDTKEFVVSNREFVTCTGSYNGKRLTVLSTGIGTDNIDIVVNEIDALANINLQTRELNSEHRSLSFVRIGTTGSLRAEYPTNSWLVSKKSIGFDGMLAFYAGFESICDISFEETFRKFVNWSEKLPTPYVVNASRKLLQLFDNEYFTKGINISAPGFYGPQGRTLRLTPAMMYLNERIEQFHHKGQRITNYEMESSALYGLSGLLGHHALTICLVITNRITQETNESYHPEMEKLIQTVLTRLTS